MRAVHCQHDGVTAEHGEGAVGEVDEPHQAHGDRKPNGDYEQHGAGGDSAQQDAGEITGKIHGSRKPSLLKRANGEWWRDAIRYFAIRLRYFLGAHGPIACAVILFPGGDEAPIQRRTSRRSAPTTAWLPSFTPSRPPRATMDGSAAVKSLLGWKFDSPQGPIMIDPETRDIVMNEYLSEVVKGSDGKLHQRVIGEIDLVNDECKAQAIGPCAPKK